MNKNQLASIIAKREGKRSQARIGDIREILKIICVIESEAYGDDRFHPDDSPSVLIAHESKKIRDKKKKKK